MQFTCIYCKRDFAIEKASQSHIIPASMGGPITLPNAECGRCNVQVARQVEDPFKDSWAWLLWCLGIRGRRGKLPPFKATLNLLGQQIEASVRSYSRAPEIRPIFERDQQGKELVHLIGPTDYVDKKQAEYSKKHPRVVWKEQDTDGVNKALLFPIDMDSLDAPFSRRLAAKIAFEFWGLMRRRSNPSELLGSEYDGIREFIRWGTEKTQPLSGLVADKVLILKNLDISFPNHAISVVAHPNERKLGAVVVLFGLFYYWVILNPYYPLSVSMSELIVINPVAKTAKHAVLVGSVRPPRIPWERVLGQSPSRVQKAWALARRKIEMSIQAARKPQN